MNDVNEHYAALKEKEINIVTTLININRRISVDKFQDVLKYYLNERKVNLSKEASCFKLYESWLCNIDQTLSVTKNGIEKLKRLLDDCHGEYSLKEVIETMDSLRYNFDIIKSNGKKKYSQLCCVEKNLQFSLLNLNIDPYKCDVVFPEAPLSKLSKFTSKIKNGHQDVQCNDEIKSVKPIISGQFIHKWHPKDHQIFLKTYVKFEEKNKRHLKLQQLLSHISTDEILSHDYKYSMYCENVKRAKSKVIEWKNKKEESDKKVNIINEDITVGTKDFDTQIKQANDRFKIKQEIKKWKQNQVLKEVRKECIIASQLNVETKKKVITYTKDEREIIKKKIELYKCKKEKKNEDKKLIAISSKAEIQRNLQLLKAKDLLFIQFKKDKVNEIQKRNSKTVSIIKKPRANTAPDNYKQHTFSSKCSLYSKRSKINPPLCVDFIPKKSIPQWRCS